MISWRLVEVSTSRTLGNQVVSIDTRRADRDYPDMIFTHPDPTDRLIAASARDSWKSLAPSVERDKVDLMVPWLQIGAMATRSGIVDAHKGRWDLAEQKFALAARRNPLNVAAHHNLAIAQAAREDFPAAKQQLSDVSWPLSLRLPAESRFWLDQRQRQFQAAHGLGKPAEGWLFPDPPGSEGSGAEVLPVEANGSGRLALVDRNSTHKTAGLDLASLAAAALDSLAKIWLRLLKCASGTKKSLPSSKKSESIRAEQPLESASWALV